MKTTCLISALVALTALGLPTIARSQEYALEWFVVGSGGDTSTNELGHSLTGTIAQPDTSTLGGGGYLVQGGFWGVYGVIQSPDTPFLQLTDATSPIRLNWQGAGFVLQRAAQVTGPWMDAGAGTNVNGFDFEFRPAALTSMEFFRLRPECAAFGSLADGPVSSPFRHQGLAFTSSGNLQLSKVESRRFLQFTTRLRVDLSSPSSTAEVVLTSSGDPGTVRAFDTQNRQVASLSLPPSPTEARAVRLTGSGIQYLVIETPSGGGAIQGVCCPYP